MLGSRLRMEWSLPNEVEKAVMMGRDETGGDVG